MILINPGVTTIRKGMEQADFGSRCVGKRADEVLISLHELLAYLENNHSDTLALHLITLSSVLRPTRK